LINKPIDFVTFEPFLNQYLGHWDCMDKGF
jgi:hypothetical protein